MTAAFSHATVSTLALHREAIEAHCDALADELQRLIGLLDALDGDVDLEPDEDTEPSLCLWGAVCDGGDDRETDAVDYREVA